MSDSHEYSYLTELMADFPPAKSVPVEWALRKLQVTYGQLLDGATQTTSALPPFDKLPLKLHHQLYQGILNNAGQYRQLHDPKQGVVFFGPRQRFRGIDPREIETAVSDIMAILKPNDETPIKTIVQFYQRFVQIHPFYDANGRIGRIIVNIYLSHYGYHMNWEGLHQNAKWLKRLNKCHRIPYGNPTYYEYLEHLIRYWKDFIYRPPLDDEADTDV